MTGFTVDRAHLASPNPLTVTQSGVAACVLDALTNVEIAAAMGRSRPAVEKHLEALMCKFGARNRVQLALILERTSHGI
jgi:DNA-binding NarL/FixJ family response regulator